MSLPQEKYNSLKNTYQFLLELLVTKRLPKEVRERARYLLKHFISKSDLEFIAKKCPKILEKTDE